MFGSRRLTLKDGRTALIRCAFPRDAEEVIAHVNTVGAEGLHLMTERVLRTPKEERARFRQADGRAGLFLVAVIDGDIVGTSDIARGRHSKNRDTASLGIALRKDARGVGLGRAMIQEMIGWAQSQGIRKLTLGVFASNRPAVALYRKLGFTLEGRLKGQVILQGKPVDELLMALWV